MRLLAGQELLDLLILHRIGVWEEVGRTVVRPAMRPAALGIDHGLLRRRCTGLIAGNRRGLRRASRRVAKRTIPAGS